MRLIAVFLLLVCSIATPIRAMALESAAQRAEFSTARLIVGKKEAPGEGEQVATVLRAGIELALTDGWKTYWRSPGDAGFPLVPSLAPNATNIRALDMHWPYPKRFIEEWGLEVFGFKEKLLLPITLELADPNADTQVEITLNYAVCSDICINEEQHLSLLVPAAFTEDSQHTALIAKARERVPEANGAHGLAIGEVAIRQESKEKGILAVHVASESPISKPELFIESETAGLRFPKPEVELAQDKRSATFLVPYEVALPAKTLEGEKLRLTFISKGSAVEHWVTVPKFDRNALAPQAGETAAPVDGGVQGAGPEPEISLPAMLVLALLGGLILNIMPCVLPVLSIKLLGAVKHGGRNSREVRQSFLASTAGILVFFLLLAGLTIVGKQAGHAMGWGFHFQSPQFLTFLTVLVLLFAANLLGWFEIRLPAWLNTHIYDVTSHGMLRHRHHLLGDFATGIFAALMATPCTAPFLGTAVGFALSRGEAEILSIFMMLGLGLALPYLAAALVPALAMRLPKPGAWMVWVKKFMGLLLVLTALWLLWVIGAQAHPLIAVGVLVLSVLLGAVLHGGGRWRFLRRKGVAMTIGVALLAALMLLPNFRLSRYQDGAVTEGAPEAHAITWRIFDRAAIAPLVKEGKVVFVDVTADWCLTCKFNKLRVLNREPVMSLLVQESIVAMRADLTRPMPEIEAYLREYGRYGIPFNIVYGPAAPDGILLSELLDSEEVIRAIQQAGGQ